MSCRLVAYDGERHENAALEGLRLKAFREGQLAGLEQTLRKAVGSLRLGFRTQDDLENALVALLGIDHSFGVIAASQKIYGLPQLIVSPLVEGVRILERLHPVEGLELKVLLKLFGVDLNQSSINEKPGDTMLAEHLVDLVAAAVLAVFGVVGKLLVLELYEVEEVRCVDVCKGMDLVKARTQAHHIQVDEPIIDMLVELLDCKIKGVGINGVAIVAIRLKTNRLTEVLHDTSD